MKSVTVQGKLVLLIDDYGNNVAVACFLAHLTTYTSVEKMRHTFVAQNLEGCWPAWVDAPIKDAPIGRKMTEPLKQEWLRHLFALEALVEHPRCTLCREPTVMRCGCKRSLALF